MFQKQLKKLLDLHNNYAISKEASHFSEIIRFQFPVIFFQLEKELGPKLFCHVILKCLKECLNPNDLIEVYLWHFHWSTMAIFVIKTF